MKNKLPFFLAFMALLLTYGLNLVIDIGCQLAQIYQMIAFGVWYVSMIIILFMMIANDITQTVFEEDE